MISQITTSSITNTTHIMSDIEDKKVESLDFDPSLKKKKKKSKPAFVEDDEVSEVADKLDDLKTSAAADDVDEFDFKKKKKKKKAPSALSEFDEELEKAGVDEDPVASGEKVTYTLDGEKEFTYPELLGRFFDILRENNPELAGDRSSKYKIPPPQLLRDGKKSIFANIQEIASKMHRSPEHVAMFIFAELGTSGSTDGNDRLVIKGRFQQKGMETVLRRYIVDYVSCATCKSVNTRLTKENRLTFLDCNSCGSRRSVSSIKTGYSAQIGRRKKM